MQHANGPDHPWTLFATELSSNLPLVARLLDQHDAEGQCHACTVDGRPPVPAPCGIRAVAALALRIRAAHEHDPDTETAPLPCVDTPR